MCGIVGYIGPNHSEAEMKSVIRRMTASIHHRGPDDEGSWVDSSSGIALGHRRLSILDLSPEGHQPMVSSCGRYIISFNGEVYNFQEIREELELNNAAPAWRGHSDTEVMLAAISHWGLMEAVKRFVGMFAFALWDKKEKTLYLVRDRLGIKPLYYGVSNHSFFFGSELKSLRTHPEFKNSINRDALALFMRHAYIPAPYSIYQGVYKLPPGTVASIRLQDIHEVTSALVFRPIEGKTFWSANEVVQNGLAKPFEGSLPEAVDQLDHLLRKAIKLRMIADVPLGAFLSGGVDSSTVVALMQAQSDWPVKTFTIGFHEGDYNEAQHAKLVAKHLDTDHTELYVTPAEAQAVIPLLPTLYDEPFADPSQIPTYLVSKLARQSVTVSLSGDGGDELFGGYNRYFWGRNLWNKVEWMPKWLKRASAKGLRSISPDTWRLFFEKFGTLLPSKARIKNPGDKIQKLSTLLQVKNFDELYLELVSHWRDPTHLVSESMEPLTPLSGGSQNITNNIHLMMYLDMVTYLPDDILVKVDRASMGVSLEARVPLLDHRVVEFAWQIPLLMKIRGLEGKHLLRQVLYRYVPKEIIERPKMGFGVPIDSWIRGPLRDWAEALLDEKRIQSEGYLNSKLVRKKWEEHQKASHNWQYYLWDVLMFQGWLEFWK